MVVRPLVYHLDNLWTLIFICCVFFGRPENWNLIVFFLNSWRMINLVVGPWCINARMIYFSVDVFRIVQNPKMTNRLGSYVVTSWKVILSFSILEKKIISSSIYYTFCLKTILLKINITRYHIILFCLSLNKFIRR